MKKKLASIIMRFAIWTQYRLKAKNFYIDTLDGWFKFNIIRGRSVWDDEEIQYIESDQNNIHMQINATQKQQGRGGRKNESVA